MGWFFNYRSEIDALTAQLAGLGDAGTFSLATLPDPATMARRTIWVLDLFAQGNTNPVYGGRMVSENGQWKPIRPLVAGAITAPTTDISTTPFLTPTTLIVTGALVAQRAVTLGMGSGFAVPYIGYRQRVSRKATGLLGLIVNGIGIGAGGWADFEFDGTTWQQTASSGLL